MLSKLKNCGHSIICIEHNLDVIKSADWIIDSGPEGVNGGEIMFNGAINDQSNAINQLLLNT